MKISHFRSLVTFLNVPLMTLLLALSGVGFAPQAALASAPSPPANVAVAGTTSKATISWTASTGATSYNIYRGTTAGGESATAIKTAQTASPYADTTVVNGTTYFYTVKAVGAGGTSGARAKRAPSPSPRRAAQAPRAATRKSH